MTEVGKGGDEDTVRLVYGSGSGVTGSGTDRARFKMVAIEWIAFEVSSPKVRNGAAGFGLSKMERIY